MIESRLICTKSSIFHCISLEHLCVLRVCQHLLKYHCLFLFISGQYSTQMFTVNLLLHCTTKESSTFLHLGGNISSRSTFLSQSALFLWAHMLVRHSFLFVSRLVLPCLNERYNTHNTTLMVTSNLWPLRRNGYENVRNRSQGHSLMLTHWSSPTIVDIR